MSYDFGKIVRYLEILEMPDDEIKARGYDKSNIYNEIHRFFEKKFRTTDKELHDVMYAVIINKFTALVSRNDNEIYEILKYFSSWNYTTSSTSVANAFGSIISKLLAFYKTDINKMNKKTVEEMMSSIAYDITLFAERCANIDKKKQTSDESQWRHIITKDNSINIDYTDDWENIYEFLLSHDDIADEETIDRIRAIWEIENNSPNEMLYGRYYQER